VSTDHTKPSPTVTGPSVLAAAVHPFRSRGGLVLRSMTICSVPSRQATKT
jgi:hypothetical protein